MKQPARAGDGGAWVIERIEPRGGVALRSSLFDVTTPAIGQHAKGVLHVEGRARPFEGASTVTVEDSHDVLAKETVQVTLGEDGWRRSPVVVDRTVEGSPSLITQ